MKTKPQMSLGLIFTASIFISSCHELSDPSINEKKLQLKEIQLPIFPLFSHVSTAPVDLTAEQVTQFQVTLATARQYALSFAQANGYFTEKPHVALELPYQDKNNQVQAWAFVLSKQPQTWRALSKKAKSYWDQPSSDSKLAINIKSMRLKNAIDASASEFYTILVSAYSFRHPLYEAHRGLPSWILESSLKNPAELGPECIPQSWLLPEISDQNFEIISYSCPKNKLIYSHSQQHIMTEHTLKANYSPIAAFNQWRDAVRRKYSADDYDKLLNRKKALWLKHLDAKKGGDR